MCLQMRRCSADMIARLRAAPEAAGDFVVPEDYDALPAGELIDLDKAWHAIHFLLVGAPWDVTMPQGTLLAGEELGEDFGYGPPRLWSVADVKAFDAVLASKPDDFVEKSLDFAALETADIYPTIWDRKDPEDIGYVADYFRILKKFVRETAAVGNGAIVALM